MKHIIASSTVAVLILVTAPSALAETVGWPDLATAEVGSKAVSLPQTVTGWMGGIDQQWAGYGVSFSAKRAGLIKAFNIKVGNIVNPYSQVKFKVIRPKGAFGHFKVVGEAGPYTLSASKLNTFKATVPVKAGDQVALTGLGGFDAAIGRGSNVLPGDTVYLFNGDPSLGVLFGFNTGAGVNDDALYSAEMAVGAFNNVLLPRIKQPKNRHSYRGRRARRIVFKGTSGLATAVELAIVRRQGRRCGSYDALWGGFGKSKRCSVKALAFFKVKLKGKKKKKWLYQPSRKLPRGRYQAYVRGTLPDGTKTASFKPALNKVRFTVK